jgi:biotin carboxyl carrier protein
VPQGWSNSSSRRRNERNKGERNKGAYDCRRLEVVGRAMVQARVGDPISIGEPLVEIEIYNLTHEIRAPATGILSKVLVRDGGSVEAGTVVGTIDQV